MSATGADSTGVYKTPPTEAPQVSIVVQVTTAVQSVPVNISTGTIQDIIGFTNTQVRVLVDDGYDSQASFLYWRFADIKEWCQLKYKIPTSCSRISYGYMKIKYLQEMDWRVTDLMLRGKIIDLNHFETDILADAIEESWLDFEDTRYVKGGLGKPKEFPH